MTKKEKKDKKNQKDPVTRALLKLAIKIVSICLVIAFVFTFIFGMYRVNDTSMVPNISPGDMILFYRLDKDFVVGETVVYSYNKENKIGRIVAMPGDVVNIDEKGLVVNNSHQYEPKIYKETLPFTDGIKYPVKLKENEIFLLADNRDKSVDSRLFGPVEKKFIKGKIFTLLRRRGI
ncbi:signal peptidase I [Anaerococcus vaginalis]|uniref:signal peptidase I n=1 Tax=Anaerococcus vaginalis TaxID=33037 RepID=UPI002912A98C|nr:signal peptidase I [Anaerococcus vaginalis]MDU5252479.1 signal peptidase I [Anaerococcus vaginalis]MDU6781907.1 signal peptidase I [Anaerococcus vaginalis]